MWLLADYLPDTHREIAMANENLPAYDDHPARFRNHPLGYIGIWILILAPVLGLLLYRK